MQRRAGETGGRRYFRARAAGAAVLLSGIVACAMAEVAWAQSVVMQVEGETAQPAPGSQPSSSPAPGGTPSQQPPPGTSADQPPADEEAKPTESEAEAAEEKDDESSDDVIERPTEPTFVADPRELEAKPDADGKVQFSFAGQTWPDVLQWLANASGYSLDWTELPSGYLNLTTQRRYSLPEARDLINHQLHARGFTMVLSGEVLSVYKISSLDPSLIPRVEEEELYDRQPSDFVKVTFQLPEGVEVAAAAEDIKNVASEHAKVLPLPATRRILMISTVGNARMVSRILNEERLAAEGQVIPDEIVLKHRRAEKIIDILYVILGLDPASRPSQQELAIQQEKMKLLAQMQGAGKDVSKLLQKDGPPVYLAFNSHRNSVLVNAPPAELRKIRRAVELLDVPQGGGGFAAADLTDGGRRVPRSYKLETMDPTTLLSTLEEIGDLSPLTELRADDKAKILFARASSADHEKIDEMIQQLDEAGMETMVYQLRRHPADAVAGTLRALFAPKKDDDSSNTRSRYIYSYFGRNDEEEEPESEIRVDADVEKNRLIVRGTPDQLQQVTDFLTKIGESLDDPSGSDRMRVVENIDPEETARMIEQLRSAWPAIGDNELVIQGPAGSDGEVEDSTPAPDDSPADKETRTEPADAAVYRFAAQPAESSDAPSESDQPTGTEDTAGNADKPPVVLRITRDGRLMLVSEDTAALDRLEQYIESARPPRERFEIIPIRYVTASSIYLTLDLLYAEEQEGEESEGYFDPYYYEYVPGESKSSSPQLSQRRKLYFDYDIATNTILVANASPSQLREIKQLIAAYDKPSRDEDAKSRRTVAIQIKYSRAKVIATALKDVYRDLLSQRDKEFESAEGKEGATAKETTTIIRYGRGTGADGDGPKRPTPVKVGFQGALSVGVDEISNTIIVSVQEELLESVLQIVESLDEAARPDTTVELHSVGNNISSEALQKALSEAMGTPWVGGRPEQPDQPERREEGERASQENGQGPPNGGGQGGSNSGE